MTVLGADRRPRSVQRLHRRVNFVRGADDATGPRPTRRQDGFDRGGNSVCRYRHLVREGWHQLGASAHLGGGAVVRFSCELRSSAHSRGAAPIASHTAVINMVGHGSGGISDRRT